MESWEYLSADIYQASSDHGFHGNSTVDNVPTKLMLIVSEIAEAMEAHRTNAPSDKIPQFLGIEEELADAIIRIMDLGHMLSINIAEAVIAKEAYNKSRPYKHGNKAY
jgi:NTP pyrophosphatase (non-canonical NTP hydrolase)